MATNYLIDMHGPVGPRTAAQLERELTDAGGQVRILSMPLEQRGAVGEVTQATVTIVGGGISLEVVKAIAHKIGEKWSARHNVEEDTRGYL